MGKQYFSTFIEHNNVRIPAKVATAISSKETKRQNKKD